MEVVGDLDKINSKSGEAESLNGMCSREDRTESGARALPITLNQCVQQDDDKFKEGSLGWVQHMKLI
jgi:hypothetical protein